VTVVRPKLFAQAAAVALVVGLLALLIWRVAHSGGGRPTGAAPSFTLPRLAGDGKLSLASFRGRVVLVNFWASWCVPCKQEAQDLEAAYRRWRGQGVVVLGIDSEDYAGDGRSFARRYGLTYPLVHESGSSVKDRYGVSGYPESFFIDRRGGVVHYVIGPLKPATIDEFVRKSLRA
jgi:cytochrome c biogenesis protein CcmG, thiol:disulfide interchange protein DsbE